MYAAWFVTYLEDVTELPRQNFSKMCKSALAACPIEQRLKLVRALLEWPGTDDGEHLFRTGQQLANAVEHKEVERHC